MKLIIVNSELLKSSTNGVYKMYFLFLQKLLLLFDKPHIFLGQISRIANITKTIKGISICTDFNKRGEKMRLKVQRRCDPKHVLHKLMPL